MVQRFFRWTSVRYDGRVRFVRCCSLAVLLALSAFAQVADSVPAVRSASYSWLRELTDSIGPRLTGSRGMEHATDWAVALMKKIGLERVHVEPFPIRSGWERGRSVVELIAPFRTSLIVASYGWTGSTTGSVEADVVVVQRETIADELQRAAQWSDKVVFVASPTSKGEDSSAFYSQFGKLVETAERARAVAVIARDFRPGLVLPHAGPVMFSAGDVPYKIPVLDIADEHQRLIERLLGDRRPVRLRLNVQNRLVPGPVTVSNISGEIAGAEHPEELVLLGAHLDSWDLGTGAIDDGAGVAAVLGAADAMLHSGKKPRRTLRFVLFTGEEEGLLGSRAWIKQHAAEIPNVVCALIVDWGQGPITALPLAGHEELKTELAPLAEQLSRTQKFRLADGFLTFTDAYPFTLAGVPGLAFYQDSKDYGLVGHSAADTFDKVDAETLARNTATLEAIASWIANSPKRVGATWPVEEIPKRLEKLKQRTMLETLGLWPFANL